MTIPKPLVLMILDGFGLREATPDNAISLAKPAVFDRLLATYPHTAIDASGASVGLPDGIMGNSEVGHTNLGAGRIVFQGLSQIYQAIDDGRFFTNPALLRAISAARDHHKTLHLFGLLSDGAVHSHEDHLFALLQMAKREGVTKVAVHAFLDGRDTPPQSALHYLARLDHTLREIGVGELYTVSGRFYAMDRDKRFDRIERAYNALVLGEGPIQSSGADAVSCSYQQGVFDEFVVPTVIKAPRPIEDGDAAIFFNFRPDRARELVDALTQSSFDGFLRRRVPVFSAFACMAEYDPRFQLPVAFEKAKLTRVFAELVAERGLTQLRIAETEKYAHVTYFFNGGDERVFDGEDRALIPSPREVSTYDQKPEMSTLLITAELLKRLSEKTYDVVVLNFASPDMVGHTGVIEAAAEAVRVVDRAIGDIVDAVIQQGGAVVITSDHGNCEQMRSASDEPHTAHTTNLVPFVLVDPSRKHVTLKSGGRLCDVAPTLLSLLNIPQPLEMTGVNLIVTG